MRAGNSTTNRIFGSGVRGSILKGSLPVILDGKETRTLIMRLDSMIGHEKKAIYGQT